LQYQIRLADCVGQQLQFQIADPVIMDAPAKRRTPEFERFDRELDDFTPERTS
jgi:hypothetical protein